MYVLSDIQIDFIRNDLRARGITRVELQDDLLDHVCCIIERNLKSDGDFEGYYQQIIPTFYRNILKSILYILEIETIPNSSLKIPNLLFQKVFWFLF